ncbi:hypothetical protein [Chelatococcus reniformis]|uniref:Sulfur globule protein n=1 Tax=Chelatococcus reniformis TaxID=1494448 RepID=A0A916XP49_9HYPH|nr:hypothetical protein [Chelatococcus reniformis]GGC91824.1 hypothetical protein GCM10010994_57010 [Chelatococcus reniformis]
MSHKIMRKLVIAAGLGLVATSLSLAPTSASAFGGHGGGFGKGGFSKGHFGGGHFGSHGPRWGGGFRYAYGPRYVAYGYACVVKRFIDEDGDIVVRRRC